MISAIGLPPPGLELGPAILAVKIRKEGQETTCPLMTLPGGNSFVLAS
jgi:hypothetical protein